MKCDIKNVTISASFFTVALMSFVFVLDTSGRAFMCFLSAVLHETGHLVAMLCFSIKPKSITLRLFDIVIDADCNRGFVPDFVITLSGPIVNFSVAFLSYFLSRDIFMVNLFIGCFNLLPIDTFDGGHLLYLILSRKFELSTVNLILKILTFIFLVPLFVIGLLVLFCSKYNYSLLMISLYLLAILFLK